MNAFTVFPLTEHYGSWLPAVPAVVLEHVEGSVSEQSSASHGLEARLLLRVMQLLHQTLTVPQQLIQTQLPADRNALSEDKGFSKYHAAIHWLCNLHCCCSCVTSRAVLNTFISALQLQ